MRKNYYFTKSIAVLLFLLASLSVSAQWNADGNIMVTPASWEILDSESQTYSNGSTYVFYNTAKDGYDQIGSYLQIVDSTGHKLLGNEGLLVSGKKPTSTMTVVNNHLLVDKDGNAIVIVPDYRHSTGEAVYSYTAYKISPKGEFLWGADGIDLNKGTYYSSLQACMNIVQLEDGSYVFAWVSYPDDKDAFIHMERYSSTGESLWNNVTISDPSYECTYPYLVNAGNNQVIVVYAGSDAYEIFARKIDFDGSSVWAKDASIYQNGFTINALQVILDVHPDPNGGVFVSWYDDRNRTNVESVYLSYIKPNGTYGFVSGQGGQKVGYSGSRGFYPDVLYSANNNAVYVGWRETNAAQKYERVMIQKLSMSGELLWDENGIEVSPWATGQVGSIAVTPDKNDNISVFYMLRDPGTAYGKVSGWVKSFNGNDGSLTWSKQFIKSSDNLEKSKLSPNDFVKGSWTALWKSSPDNNIYLNRVTTGITSGVENHTAGTDGLTISKTANSTARFTFNSTSGLQDVDVSVYDISGKKVADIYNGKVPAGKSNFFWTTSSVGKGVYIGVVQTAGTKYTQKIIL